MTPRRSEREDEEPLRPWPRISVTEFKRNFDTLWATIEAGQAYVITKRGKDIVLVIPVFHG